MGNCIGKCFHDFWSFHGIPLHFIAISAIICSSGLCPWIAMLGFIPASYLLSIFIYKKIKKNIKKRSERKELKRFLKYLYENNQKIHEYN